MALCIGLAARGRFDLDSHEQFCLDEEYYWFLLPALELLTDETGQKIDLYDTAVFEGASLSALIAAIDRARTAVEQGHWDDGVKAHCPGGDVAQRKKWRNEGLVHLLDRWRTMATKAVQSGRRIVCVGD